MKPAGLLANELLNKFHVSFSDRQWNQVVRAVEFGGEQEFKRLSEMSRDQFLSVFPSFGGRIRTR